MSPQLGDSRGLRKIFIAGGGLIQVVVIVIMIKLMIVISRRFAAGT